MQSEEDLSGPRPIENERPAVSISQRLSASTGVDLLDPKSKPSDLEDTLDCHTAILPPQPSFASASKHLHWHNYPRTADHCRIAESKFPCLVRQQIPHLVPQRKSSVFNISKRGCKDHDCQPDPEEHKKPSEISIFASWVEMGDSSSVLDCRENPVLLLSSDMLASGGRGYCGRRSVIRYWS